MFFFLKSNGSLTASRSSSNGSLTSSTTERLKNTVVEPFSFEDRDKMLQRKREIKIKKVGVRKAFSNLLIIYNLNILV